MREVEFIVDELKSDHFPEGWRLVRHWPNNRPKVELFKDDVKIAYNVNNIHSGVTLSIVDDEEAIDFLNSVIKKAKENLEEERRASLLLEKERQDNIRKKALERKEEATRVLLESYSKVKRLRNG